MLGIEPSRPHANRYSPSCTLTPTPPDCIFVGSQGRMGMPRGLSTAQYPMIEGPCGLCTTPLSIWGHSLEIEDLLEGLPTLLWAHPCAMASPTSVTPPTSPVHTHLQTSPPFLRLVPRLWTDLTGWHPACCCSVQGPWIWKGRPFLSRGRGKPHNCSSRLCPRHWGVGIGERLRPLGFGPAIPVPQYQDMSPLMRAYACSAAPRPCHTSRAGLKPAKS